MALGIAYSFASAHMIHLCHSWCFKTIQPPTQYSYICIAHGRTRQCRSYSYPSKQPKSLLVTQLFRYLRNLESQVPAWHQRFGLFVDSEFQSPQSLFTCALQDSIIARAPWPCTGQVKTALGLRDLTLIAYIVTRLQYSMFSCYI